MPEAFEYTVTTAVAGVPYAKRVAVTSTSVERATPSVAAAKAGSLTTRTDNTSGTLTMDAGHGFTTSAVIDLFWAGGSRRNVTVGTVSGNSVPVSGGSGDNLPLAATAVTAMLPTQIAFSADATSTGQAVVAACPVNGWVVFRNSTTVLAAYQIRAGQGCDIWMTGLGANPLAAAAVTNVLFSHADATQPQTLTALAAF